MAFTLGSFELLTTETQAGVLGPFESASTLSRITTIGPFEVATDITARPFKLPQFIVGDDGPVSTVYDVGGGIALGGEAAREFVLNGVPTVDPALHVINASGGIELGGEAPFVDITVLRYGVVGMGGVQLSGMADVGVDWTQTAMSGGIRLGGAAATTFVPYPVAVIDAQLPVVSASITAPNTQPASIKSGLPVITAAVTASTGMVAYVNARLPAPNVSLTALLGSIGTIAARLHAPKASANGYTGTAATIAARLPAPTARASGHSAITAVVVARLPAPAARFDAGGALTWSTTALVANLRTAAVSEYANYPFNSFAAIDGSYYAAGPNGLFKLELNGTNDDDGAALTPISALFRFGVLDFGSEYQKRMSDCYATMRAEGDMTLRVYVDEQEPYEYTISPHDVSRLKQRRSLIGKGAKGKNWQLEFENTDGCAFDFDTINLAAVPLTRRL